jgi:O-antigen/teichoic acid export membrane protein
LKRKFVTNLALLLFLNILVKPFWVFGIDTTVQNVVGSEEYGFYFTILQFSFLLNILLDFGINNFNSRNIAQNRQLLKKHLSSIIVIRLILAVVYFIISVIIAAILGWLQEGIRILFLLLFNQFLLSFILYFRSNLAGLHLFKTDSLISVLDRFLMIVICGLLLWGNITEETFKIEWFVYAQTVSYILTAFIVVLIIINKSGKFRLNLDTKFFFAILKKSYPFALLTLLMASYSRIDTIFLKQLLEDGNVQAGIFAHGFRILDAASMYGFLFAGLLLPIFARMLKLKESVSQMVVLSYTLIIVPAIILSLSSFFYRVEIMDLLYEQHIEESARAFGVLILGFMFFSTSYIFGTLLTANGNLKALNTMALFGIIVNIVLNLILVPKLEALGAAYTSLATQAFTAGAQVFIVMRIFKFRFNLKIFFSLLIYFVGVILIGILSRDLPYQWYLSYFIMITLSVLLAFGIKLLSVKDMYKIIKYDN